MQVPGSSDPRAIEIPLCESPFLERLLEEDGVDGETRRLCREFAERGYLVVDLELDGFEERAVELIRALEPRYPDGPHRRVEEAWMVEDAARRIATAPAMLDLLERLYRRRPIPFQTLNFDRGSEQRAHSDTLHFHCVPRRFMCGVWVALEDVAPDSGPLVVYPGSHRPHELDMFDLGLTSEPEDYSRYELLLGELIEAWGYEPEVLTPKRGQAVIWSANLLHGGLPIENPGSTRHSQVTHYYFENGFYYFPMSSDPYTRSLCMREVIDITTGRFVKHLYRGEELHIDDYRLVSAYPRPLPDWVEQVPAPKDDVQLESDAMVRARLRILRESLESQRATIAELSSEAEEHRALLADRQSELERVQKLLHDLWQSRSFRFVHGLAKTFGRAK